MYNYYREDWLIDRLAATLETFFGSDRCVIAPRGEAGLALPAAGPGLAEKCPTAARDISASAAPVTDDHPFLYIGIEA